MLHPASLPKISAMLLAAAAAASGCGPAATDDGGSSLAAALPARGAYLAGLGSGFRPDTGRLTGMPCVQGELSERAEVRATLVSEADLSAEALADSLSVSAMMQIPLTPIFSGIGKFNVATDFAATAYNQTFATIFQLDSGARRLDPIEVSTDVRAAYVPHRDLAPDTAMPSPQSVCGQEYVAEIRYGASLRSVMKIEYRNAYERRKWGGAVGVALFGGIAKVTLGLSKMDEATRRSTLISLIVEQTGGQAEELLRLFPAAEADRDGQTRTDTGLMSCTLDNVQPCLEAYNSVLAYAAKRLPLQLAVPGDDAVISMITAPYPEDLGQGLGLAEALSASSLARLRGKRLTLQRLDQQTRQDLRRVRTLQSFFRADSDDAQREDLAAAADTLQANELIYARQIAACWDAPASCVDLDVEHLDHVRPVDPWVFEVNPRRFADWCALGEEDLLDRDEARTVAMLKLAAGKSDCQEAAVVLDAMTSLALVNKALRNLEPLGALQNLVHLDLRQNAVADPTPLSGLRKLKTLRLDSNQIANLTPFTHGTWRLDSLDLSQNRVGDLAPLGTFEWKIPRLNLDLNPLHGPVPALGAAPALRELSLSGDDGLTDLAGLSQLAAIERLTLRGLKLSNLGCPLASRSEACLL